MKKKPKKIYNPATDPNVSFEDAVQYYIENGGLPKERAEFTVAMMRGKNPGVREETLEDGTVVVYIQ